mgnify:CR=1 FL=1
MSPLKKKKQNSPRYIDKITKKSQTIYSIINKVKMDALLIEEQKY